jgi:hypothetical protein
MVRPVRLLCGLALVGAGLLGGCARSPAAQAREAATALASWEATVRLLQEQRARGAVPEPYARQVIRAAEEGRAQAKAQLRAAAAP